MPSSPTCKQQQLKKKKHTTRDGNELVTYNLVIQTQQCFSNHLSGDNLSISCLVLNPRKHKECQEEDHMRIGREKK
jgi:hypothetical protein